MNAILIAPSERPAVVQLAENAPLAVIPILGKPLAAYWLEKSKSVIAPIIGHGAAGFVSYGLLLGLVTLWT